MKIYLLQAKLSTEWLTCYRFNNRSSAEEHMAYMNKEYTRPHRIVESN
jgi:hypothetical protein